jgi:hypothetical protein
MSTDPKTFALQEKNCFANAIVFSDEVILSGAGTELANYEADMEAAYTKTFETVGQILDSHRAKRTTSCVRCGEEMLRKAAAPGVDGNQNHRTCRRRRHTETHIRANISITLSKG